MKVYLDSSLELGVDSFVPLRGLRPVLNGVELDVPAEVMGDEQGINLRYRFAAGTFGVEIERMGDSRLGLRYHVGGFPGEQLYSFGIRFMRTENLRAYLRNGYSSWDGSFYVEPEAMTGWEEYEPRPETGYAMTQLLPREGTGCVLIGFDRHDRFQHTFTFDTRRAPISCTVETLWDGKPGGQCESERLVFLEHTSVEQGLREWARMIADAAPVKPRYSKPITGWCSWYNLYAYINEGNILEHLNAVAQVAHRENLPMRVFQIDDGFTPEMGDWLEVKPQFPRGIKPLLDDIRAAGFVPGLWIGPFMVGNRSHLYRDHPDWVVLDRATGGPLIHWRFYGEFRWHKRSEEYYILDATHPDAFEYLRSVFRTWRQDWGCEYFKTDFMFWGAEYGPDRARWHTSGMTRIEIWRRVAEMIRAEIGDGTWLGCGCPLWASVGLVDGIRIGSDVGVEWRGHLSAQSLLRDQATRNFANHILWQTDPDCILLREHFHHLSEAEVRSLAIYAGMCGGVTMTSDNLAELSPERLRLWKLLLNEEPTTCRFPLLGQSAIRYERLPADVDSHRVRHIPATDPVLVQVRGDNPLCAVFVFNTGDVPVQRSYNLRSLGIDGPRYTYDWLRSVQGTTPTDRLSLSIAPHDGSLLFLSATPLTSEPEHLP